MKFLIESMDERLEPIFEQTEKGSKLYLEGPFLMAERKNRNGRIYPKQVMEQAVDMYQRDYVSERRALGEINHPERPNVDIREACMLIESLTWDGNIVNGKSQVLNNPNGIILKSLIEANFKLGVSSRGLGKITERSNGKYVDRYMITAIDAVDRPSADVAYVNAINESIEYEEKDGVWVPSGINHNKLMNNIDRLIENMKKQNTK